MFDLLAFPAELAFPKIFLRWESHIWRFLFYLNFKPIYFGFPVLRNATYEYSKMLRSYWIFFIAKTLFFLITLFFASPSPLEYQHWSPWTYSPCGAYPVSTSDLLLTIISKQWSPKSSTGLTCPSKLLLNTIGRHMISPRRSRPPRWPHHHFFLVWIVKKNASTQRIMYHDTRSPVLNIISVEISKRISPALA